MDNELIEREAELFQAGEYPDKGVTVTEDDLDAIVAAHPADGVPLRIEHGSTPFDGFLGRVKSIWRDGVKLLGKVEMPMPAWALADYAGAKKLSVGMRPDKSSLSEVSLVVNPRVATAQMFTFDAGDFIDQIPLRNGVDYGQMMAHLFAFAAQMGGNQSSHTQGGDTEMTEEKKSPETETKPEIDFGAELTKRDEAIETLRKQNEALQFANRKASVAATLKDLKAEGKLVPAAAEFAEAILLYSGDEVITFAKGDGTELKGTVGELFAKLMAAQPAIVEFGERGRSGDSETVEFSDDEIATTMRLYPGETREQVVERMKKAL